MIQYIIPLLSKFVNSGIFQYVLYPIFVLLFLVTVPTLFKSFFRK